MLGYKQELNLLCSCYQNGIEMKEISSAIILHSKKGLKTKEQKLTVKGRNSRRTKAHKFAKVERFDTMHSNKVQKAIDLSERIKEGKNETAKRKAQSKANRANFKANRKAKHVCTV